MGCFPLPEDPDKDECFHLWVLQSHPFEDKDSERQKPNQAQSYGLVSFNSFYVYFLSFYYMQKCWKAMVRYKRL